MDNLYAKNILVIDDEHKIVEIIKAYLEKAGAIVFAAYTGYEGLEIFEKNTIDLVLLDLMLPDISGENVCRKIRQISNVPIIMVTAKVDEADELAGLGEGADDYITKPFSYKILLARMSALLRRKFGIHEDNYITTDGILEISLQNKSVKKNGWPVAISKIEMNILIELIKSPEKTFTRDEIIQSAMGFDFDGFDRTIDTHIKNLRKKIEDNPKNPKYIITVYGIGYRFGTGLLPGGR